VSDSTQIIPAGDEYRELKVTRLSIVPKGESIFNEKVTHIETHDEAAGEYLRVVQQSDRSVATEQTIEIEPAEWPLLRRAIDYMIENCRS
jgi:hypothetical protein